MARRSEYVTGPTGGAKATLNVLSQSVCCFEPRLRRHRLDRRGPAALGSARARWPTRPRPFREPRLVPGAEAAWHRLLLLHGTSGGIDGDCRPTRAYLTDDGQWRALIDGKWVLVPPRAVLKQLAPDGRSHICASRTGVIYCFLGGSPKS